MKTKTRLILALFLGVALQVPAALPLVTNCTTYLYANVTDPMKMAFGTNGALYVGRDNTGSGGSPGDAVPISEIRNNGALVEAYGPPVADPDAVGYDALGLAIGGPAKVVIAGANVGGGARFTRIDGAGAYSTIFGGVVNAMGNPGELLFDAAGRLFISDTAVEKVFVGIAPNQPPAALLDCPGAYELAIDANNRLAVGSFTQPRIQLFSTNGTLINSNFATIRPGAPVVKGPGDTFWGSDLYSVNAAGQLIRITPAGDVTAVGSGFGGEADAGLVHLAFGPDSALYYSHRSEDRVLRIAPSLPARVPQPAHWWPGEGNANDLIGDAHGVLVPSDGYTSNTVTPRVSYPAGVVGQAFRFDTNGSAFNYGTNAANVGTNDFSLAFWFKSTNTVGRGLFGNASQCSFSSSWTVSIFNNGAIRFLIRDTVYAADNYTIAKVCDDQWHHIVCVRSNLTPRIFVDGILSNGGNTGSAGSSTPQPANITNSHPFRMGGSAGTVAGACVAARNLNDAYDEVQLYDTALTPSQIVPLATLQVNTVLPRLEIVPAAPGFATIAWTPPVPGFTLQSAEGSTPTNWVGAPSGTNNPATVPASQPARFFRLLKP
jgi:hypothetical protein